MPWTEICQDMYAFVLSLSRLQKQLILLGVDLGLIPVSLLLATFIATGSVPALADIWPFLTILIAAGAAASHGLDLPRIQLKAYEHRAALRTIAYAALVGAVCGLTGPAFLVSGSVGPVVVSFTMVLIVLSVASRLAMHGLLLEIYRRGTVRRRVLIYGAGQTGVQLAAALTTDNTVEPVAFADDNQSLQGMVVAGLPVYPPIHLDRLIADKSIDRAVLAMPSIGRQKQARIAARLAALGCEVSALPSFASLVGEGDLLDRVVPVDPGRYLGRDGLECGLDEIGDIYAGASVMITGAGGSIGAELCRQVFGCRPKRLVLFEIGEHALYQIERELSEGGDSTEIVAVLGSVADESQVTRALRDNRVDIVLHAAAYKHVPMVERNPLIGLQNNTIGTLTVARAARSEGVGRFVMVSTDKAVNPTSIMGASKRLAEMAVMDLSSRSEDTRYCIVRFGNVLGSSGSVIPVFAEQIARGGPLTLTHSEMTRYFMTIPEAARLVLLSGGYSAGGEIFVLDMGRPVAIGDLARQMVEAAGRSVRDADNPDGDIEIVVTGLRRGEKLTEELTVSGDLRATRHPKILSAREPRLSEIEIASALRDLREAIEVGDEAAARASIARWIENFGRPSEETAMAEAAP